MGSNSGIGDQKQKKRKPAASKVAVGLDKRIRFYAISRRGEALETEEASTKRVIFSGPRGARFRGNVVARSEG